MKTSDTIDKNSKLILTDFGNLLNKIIKGDSDEDTMTWNL